MIINLILVLIIVFLLLLLSMIWPPDSPWAPWWRTNKKVAAAIGKMAGINSKDIVYDLDLIERDYGVLTGQLRKDLPLFSKKILQGDKIEYFLDGRGTEPFAQVYKRAKKVLAKLRLAAKEGNIIVVTHGDFGMMLRAVANGWTWRQGLEAPYWDNAEIIILKENI